MPQEVACPRCTVRLLIREGSPLRMTCPRCLGLIINPQALAGGPLQVLPLEREVAADSRATSIGLLALGILLIVIAIVALMTAQTVLIPGFLFLGGIGAGWASFATRSKSNAEPSTAGESTPLSHYPPDDRFLAYQSQQAYRNEPGIRALPFIGGFFGSLGACIVVFVIFLATLNASQMTRQLLVVIAFGVLAALAIGSGYLGRRQSFSGIGRGTAIGLALGMFALGPCAFCYALM